ncbi:MAG: hypothetical protein ACJZ72_01895 [Opitutales bacterium]
MKKKIVDPSDNYITKRQATLLLGFKNSRSITELIKHGYLQTHMIDASKRELLRKSEVLNLPKKDPPPTHTESEVRT